MNKTIVINTSPLIALAHMQAFSIVLQLPFDFVCPEEVAQEILAGLQKGHPVSLPPEVNVQKIAQPISPLALAALDSGEAAVIQLALEQQIETVCIDEIKGRRAALSVGLKVVGSLGLLGSAKTQGLISEIRPLIDRAKQAGIFYDDNLVNSFLSSFGE
jgi:predicted nucleic acid-binding protein